jgi:hypothetical protein
MTPARSVAGTEQEGRVARPSSHAVRGVVPQGSGLLWAARPGQHFHVSHFSSPLREPSDQATGVSIRKPSEPWPG